ncbi:glycerophosphodiester phosphodiesterase family protein [Evansella cellulosilytica]|uniref:Glycerophosphoryl diester phosphodiesterase n=1 Tax=Evansella cellulosilytica (strain ATCC 21833 / DSM 2522 / FERM P-1141 / JCM 9156 / N-4) TaxID=649639 RepID=E6TW58_EVAC2|nr:glycerophosphodiester phosphodiesterase family protein [Evansella cellulosilytica]ADU29881.1 glycerophosphoryl diester phosphodiesterase [Evansella cellulosilytica DSM 2522]
MKIIAHRGNKQYYPENTMISFHSAAMYPIDGIEFDLQLTKDEIPVVIHDDKIDRTTNGTGSVSSYTFDELKKYDAGSWFHSRFRGERIPSLEEVVHWAKDKELTLHIELKRQKRKTNRYLHACLQIIDEYNMNESVVISTFFHPYLNVIKQINPAIRTALLTKLPVIKAVKYAKKVNADAIHIRHTFQSSYYYQRWTLNGLPVRAYNVKRLRDALKCQRHNIDAIITSNLKQLTDFIRSESMSSP